MVILLLNDKHDRKGFDCGDEILNRWLVQMAKQHKEKGISSTFVATEDESSTIVLGYYALSFTELVNTNIPARFQKKLPERLPAYRLGRLAVDKRQQGKHLGEFLLFDAIDKVTEASNNIGGIGLIVNAKPNAVSFYKRYGFEPMEDHPQNLFLKI